MKRKPDYIFIGISIALLVLGLVILASAGQVIGQEKFNDPFYYLKHQIFYGLLPGLIGMFLALKIKYTFWKKISLIFLVFSLILLCLVFFPKIGYEFKGAKRWIGIGKISFQPTEIAKLSFIIYLAGIFSKSRKIDSSSIVPFLVVLFILGCLIALQPDIGTLGVFVIIGGVMYFLAGGKISHLIILILIGGIIGYILIQSAPYRMARLTIFLHPEKDPQGIGYQINQALLAIGSGGLFGRGIGHSLQKWNYIPEPIGDSIFAIAGEELGFIRITLLIGLFLALTLRGIKIAKNCEDKFGSLLAGGIVSWIIIQAFIHMAGVTSLVPFTGIPLPFISYGGSALVVSLIGVGIIGNISKYSYH